MNKGKWYLNRLASMSFWEVNYRIKQKLIANLEKLKYSKPSFVGDSNNHPELFPQFINGMEVNFFFNNNDRENLIKEYKRLFPENYNNTCKAADELLAHNFSIFNRKFYLGEDIDWHKDPLTEKRWPVKFWSDIDIRDAKSIGGVKWVWELNRHNHLITLSKAYFLTGNEHYSEEAVAQILSWIEANPPKLGVNWTSSLELSIRLINWIWAISFIKSSEAFTQRVFEIIFFSIGEQTKHISQHLSAFSSANNHLIGEAAGLAIVGIFFPWLKNSNLYQKKGFKILEEELEKQIFPDGGTAEQAISYLSFILEFNIIAWKLAELNGKPIPKIWSERLEASCFYLVAFMDKGGKVPAIGDNDNAIVVDLDNHHKKNNLFSIMASAASLVCKPEFKKIAKSWDEKSHWLLGIQGKNVYDSLPFVNYEPPSKHFMHSGYCVMRSGNTSIVFDCGSLGYLSTSAHGHADALNVTISKGENSILIDPGTYAYQEGGQWRKFFRGTMAHNTMVVDCQDQSEIKGPFLWGKKAGAYLEKWESNTEYDFAVAYHDGYKSFHVIHRRSILFSKPDLILIKDYLEGRGVHSFRQLWHLPALYEVEIKPAEIEITFDNEKALIIPMHQNLVTCEIKKGQHDPIQGWVSPYYGCISPAPVIDFSGTSEIPVDILTAIYLPFSSKDVDRSVLLNRIYKNKKIIEGIS
jgi:hypothetical protein